MDCPYCNDFAAEDEDRVKDHMVDSHWSELPSFTDSTNCQRKDCGGTVPAGDRRCNLNDHDHARYFAGLKLAAGRTVQGVSLHIPDDDD